MRLTRWPRTVRPSPTAPGVTQNIILDMAARLGLHAKKYGTGRNTALAVSKRPLPNYRADLDNREREFELEMSSRQQRIVEDALDELNMARPSETDPAQLRRRGREMLSALPVEDHRPPQKRRGAKADAVSASPRRGPCPATPASRGPP